MKTTRAILIVPVLLFALSAVAEDRFEVYGEYSYLNFSPTIAGLSSRNFNGGGGGASLYFLKVLGIKADAMGYGSTTFTRTYPTAVPAPGGGTIPAGTYSASATCSPTYSDLSSGSPSRSLNHLERYSSADRIRTGTPT
jgi:hypothetical protein